MSSWIRTDQGSPASTPMIVATIVLVAALVVIALCTFKDYAISNDEAVQHHYGELIIAYYTSGFRDQSLFSFLNLYLYGGLFDIVAVALSHLVPIDPYDLRHILCALIGIGGIGAAAATARLIAGPRAGLIAAIGLSVCGAWYGSIFNHTKDIPFAAAMIGRDAVPDPDRALPAHASRRRHRRVRPARGSSPWYARPRFAAGDLCRRRDRPVHAAAVVRARPGAVAFRIRFGAAVVAGAAARLRRDDPGLAVGGAVAAQSDPRPARVLRI